MLLGLAHAEEMSAILGADIADQKEREEYVYIPTNAKGETMNQLRFKSAANLASGELPHFPPFGNPSNARAVCCALRDVYPEGDLLNSISTAFSHTLHAVHWDHPGDDLRPELSGPADRNAPQSARVIHPVDGGGLFRNADLGIHHDCIRLQQDGLYRHWKVAVL